MHELTEKLRPESHRGALTSLLNRRGFNPLIKEAASNPDEDSALFVDLDGFKADYDLAELAKGDAIFCQVAYLVMAAVRSDNSVAEFGGDEFVVLLGGCDRS